jgi:hypothetical protein
MADPSAPSFDDLAALAAQLPSDGKPSAAALPASAIGMLGLLPALPPQPAAAAPPPITPEQEAYFSLGMEPPAPPSIDDMVRKAMLQGVDTSTGAPVMTRALVGSAPEADKLATLRQTYPDAAALPGGNFVYTDPATGKRQTYAPMGWRIPSVGDIASVGGEIGEGLGGTAGAALGVPSGPLGVAAGGGLGAAAGKEGWQALMRVLGAQDTRTPVERGVDLATTAGLNAVLPEVGSFAGRQIASLLQPGPPTATQAAARALDLSGLTKNLATTLPGGIASESTAAQKLEQPLFSLPFSGGVREAYGGTKTALEEGTQAAAQRAAGGGPVPVPGTFAATVGDISKQIDQAWQLSRENADNAAMGLIGADRPVDLQPLRDLRTQLQAQLDAAPQSLSARYAPALARLDKILGDATTSSSPALPGGAGTLPFSVVRNIRTDIGKEIDWTSSGAEVPTGVPAMRGTYDALKQSLLGAAHDAGPQAEAALAAHDAMVSAYRAPDGPADTFATLMDPARRSDRLAQMMQSTKPADQNALAHLVHYATPEQRQELAAGTIQQMGTTKDGTFDMPTWFNNYKATSQPARDMMFGSGNTVGSLQADLNNLATVQRTMSASSTAKNFSNSAPTYAVVAGLGALGDILGHLSGGEIGAAAGAAAGLAAPPALGRLMTSQPFVKWLTGTWGVNGADAAQWGAHLARLGTVAQADPKVAGLVAQLRQQLPDQLPPSAPPR